VALALAAFGGKRGNVVAGQVKETLVPCGFFVGVYVLSLTVLHLSLVLQKQSMTSTTMKFCTSWNLYL
jgi:hypothetical protein